MAWHNRRNLLGIEISETNIAGHSDNNDLGIDMSENIASHNHNSDLGNENSENIAGHNHNNDLGIEKSENTDRAQS
eukprot:778352-Lingulodinium_polyedra.AAC.1